MIAMRPPRVCLECGAPVAGWHGLGVHQRDTGDAPLGEGRCPVLWERRNPRILVEVAA